MARDKDYTEMINSSRWRKLRNAALAKHPMCVSCQKEGRLTLATQVHHIRPVETAIGRAGKAALMFDPTNLMPLCEACHTEIHKRLGRGRAASKARAEEKTSQAISRFFPADCPKK